MLSQLREAAAKALEVFQGFDETERVRFDKIMQVIKDAGMPIIEIEADRGFYINRYYTIIPVDYGKDMVKPYYGTDPKTSSEYAEALFAVSSRRIQVKVWAAYLWALRQYIADKNGSNRFVESSYLHINLTTNSYGSGSSGSDEVLIQPFMLLMEAMKEVVLSKQSYIYGDNAVVQFTDNATRKMKTLGYPDGKKSISTLFDKKPLSAKPDAEVIKSIQQQVKAAYAAMPSQAITSRTWGWEMEIADAKGVNAVFGVDKGDDGSLRSYESNSDCDCSCDDCYYHECDCEHCETGSSDPDHCQGSSCSNADSAEFRTKNGINRLKHPGLFKITQELEAVEAEVNDTCGFHVHVYAQDLETKQVAHVLAAYKYLENIFAIIAERDDVNYAQRIPIEYVRTAYKGKLPVDKPRAVNLTHLSSSREYLESSRGTIEFRQLAGTYDAELVTIWAWLMRGLVTTASRGMQLKDFLHVTDVNGIIEVFAKFNYFLHDEGAELLIPGGQQDKKHIKLYAHERA